MTSGYRIVASTGTDQGDREYQQDQICLIPHPRVQGCVLGVVADGMGGKSGGRKAADQVLLTARQLFERYDPLTDSTESFLQQLTQEAHVVIRLTAISAEQEPHSTIAAFVLRPQGDCFWGYCGDSRLYHFHNDQLVHRSKDHSFVQMLVDRGELTEEQAKNHPRSNILLHCLGDEADPLVTLHHIPQMSAGDCLMACSDGVWHYFTTQELAQVLHALTPRQACELLIKKARERAQGKGDNLSLIVLKFEPLHP